MLRERRHHKPCRMATKSLRSTLTSEKAANLSQHRRFLTAVAYSGNLWYTLIVCSLHPSLIHGTQRGRVALGEIFSYRHFYSPAYLVGGFTLSFLGKPRSQVLSVLLPGTRLQLYRAKDSALPLLVDFRRMVLTHALALSANQFPWRKTSLRVCTE